MVEPVWRIEAHLWFKDLEEYAKREKELHEILSELHGDSSIIIFFRATPEFVETGAGYNHMDDEQARRLMDFCGRSNIDFVARVSGNAERKLGFLRWKDDRA